MDGGARVAPGAMTESNAGIDTWMYRSRVMQEQLPSYCRNGSPERIPRLVGFSLIRACARMISEWVSRRRTPSCHQLAPIGPRIHFSQYRAG